MTEKEAILTCPFTGKACNKSCWLFSEEETCTVRDLIDSSCETQRLQRQKIVNDDLWRRH